MLRKNLHSTSLLRPQKKKTEIDFETDCGVFAVGFCNGDIMKFKFFCEKQDEKSYYGVCKIGDTVIASGGISESEEGEFEITDLAVDEHYRNAGVGTAVLNELKCEAKKRGAKEIFAEIPLDTLGFFEKNGIAKCGVSYIKNGKRTIKCRENLVFDGIQWVGFENESEAVVARCDFFAKSDVGAELFVTGLGYCEIYINGKSISDRVLAPAWTNYVKFDTQNLEYPIYDTMTTRILYEKFDVTPFLQDGKNTIIFHIGGGWFCQRESRNEGVKPYGDLKLCFKITQNEKIIAKSGESVKYKKSFVTRTNIYFGEEHDARLGGYDFGEIDDENTYTKNADIVERPLALLSEQNFPPDKVVSVLHPKCIFKKGDYAIYDIGENISGYPVIEFPDNFCDEQCSLRFAEELNNDGSLNFDSAGGSFRIQRARFIHDGKCKEYSPHFTWFGARYFEAVGNINVKEYRCVHTDIKQIVAFKSSNETLQWIFDAYVRTQLNNIHGCIPSDCPHRERLGYTGDGQLTADTVMTCFDAEGMYRKWMRDIADCQDIYNGHVQHTAPFYGGGGGPGGWGGAVVIVPYTFYKHYRDESVLREYYPNMLLYLDYMASRCENGLVVREEPDGWCLGDWCSPENKNLIPEPFVNTYFYIKTLAMTKEIAKILGEPTAELEKRLEETKTVFAKNYFDEKTETFCDSKEGADAYGFDLGLGTEKTLTAIVEKYEALGEFDTGIFGTDILIRVLCENGYKDLAFKLLTSEKENTYYNMKKQGATTLWENWNGEASHSHPMFGSVIAYIVAYFNEKDA